MNDSEQTIGRLKAFKSMLRSWDGGNSAEQTAELRSKINVEKAWVRQQVIEAGCFTTITIGPPPAIGGLVMQNQDQFDLIFQTPYRIRIIPGIIDMIDEAIGALLNPIHETRQSEFQPSTEVRTVPGYAFIAMPMNSSDPELEDVLDAIKEGAARCGVQAERIDELESNERITDRILESICKAEFVIVDLTFSKPNVYFEAGYAHGIGKVPIYVARQGTVLEFDLKDYPVLFFKNMKQLKDLLEKRLRGVAEKRV